MGWIIKNNLVSNQLGVKYLHSISDISTWYRNSLTIFADDYVCLCRGCIIVSKRFFNWHRSIDIRIPVKSIRNTDGWNSSYSFL